MKIELVLLIYDALAGGGSVARGAFCAAHSISERTFYRYMHAISEFLRAHRPAFYMTVLEPEGVYSLAKDR